MRYLILLFSILFIVIGCSFSDNQPEDRHVHVEVADRSVQQLIEGMDNWGWPELAMENVTEIRRRGGTNEILTALREVSTDAVSPKVICAQFLLLRFGDDREHRIQFLLDSAEQWQPRQMSSYLIPNMIISDADSVFLDEIIAKFRDGSQQAKYNLLPMLAFFSESPEVIEIFHSEVMTELAAYEGGDNAYIVALIREIGNIGKYDERNNGNSILVDCLLESANYIELQRDVCNACMYHGNSTEIISLLRQIFNDGDSDLSRFALLGLAKAEDSSIIIPELVEYIGNEPGQISLSNIILALQYAGPAAVDALPALRELLYSPDNDLKLEILDAIQCIEDSEIDIGLGYQWIND